MATRKFGSGVGNIVRFNWHFFALAGTVIVTAFIATAFVPAWLLLPLVLGMIAVTMGTIIPLVVSFFVYDLNGIYGLKWLSPPSQGGEHWVHVHAGFDEISHSLQRRFPSIRLSVFDFYDPVKHTEVSIRRARRVTEPFPGTESVRSDHLELPDNSVDRIILFLSAHEVRDPAERIAFLRELKRVAKPHCYLELTEHLRDAPNFLAYNLGAFHFHARRTWLRAFDRAGLKLVEEEKITPFISHFTLVTA